MKTLLVLITAIIFFSCSDNNSGQENVTDYLQKINSDSVPTGNSSSPSDFNKGSSSPPGSTGGVDSTAAAGGAVPDNTKSDLDNRHPEINKMADSLKQKK